MAAKTPVLPFSVPHPSPTSIARKPHRLESVQMMRAVAALMVCVWHLAFFIGEIYPSSITIALRRLPLGNVGSRPVLRDQRIYHDVHHASAVRAARQRSAFCHQATGANRSILLVLHQLGGFHDHRDACQPAYGPISSFARVVVIFVYPLILDRSLLWIQPLYSRVGRSTTRCSFTLIFHDCGAVRARTGLIIILATFGLAFGSARFGVWDHAFNLFWGMHSILFEVLAWHRRNLSLPATREAHEDHRLKHILLAAATRLAGGLSLDRYRRPATPVMGSCVFSFSSGCFKGFAHAGSHWPGRWFALGDASYSRYLSHSFVIAIFVRAAARWGPKAGPSEILSAVLFGTLVTACIVVAVIFYRYCERPVTDRLSSRFLERRPEAGAGPACNRLKTIKGWLNLLVDPTVAIVKAKCGRLVH